MIHLAIKILIIYYLIINIISFIFMWYDKSQAKKGKRRISESTLFVIAVLGGSIGGIISMKVFHHKTKKISFYIIYIVSIILHASLIYFIVTKSQISYLPKSHNDFIFSIFTK